MRILFLSPQPFFQERGTPIAVRMALEVLRARENTEIDLLVYPAGESVEMENVRILRSWAPRLARSVGAGLSWRKLVCDLFFLFSALRLVFRSYPWGRRYDVIHAVEEAGFIALFINFFTGIPFLYDMDSSLSLQVVEKMPALRPLKPIFEMLERGVIRRSISVVPVCDALAVIALDAGSRNTKVLHDFSLLSASDEVVPHIILRDEAGVERDKRIALYVGNLERYQGIDLLLAAWKLRSRAIPDWHLVLIGGSESHRAIYQAKITTEGLERVHLLGPRPTRLLGAYLKQADILLSPRIDGNNTPMKLYSYLHAGVATLATDLPTHTQVLTSDIAVLADPAPEAFARGLERLALDGGLRAAIAAEAQRIAHDRFTFDKFKKTLNEIYDHVGDQLARA